MTISEQIGFIGLGNMGVPMAGRLIDGGYSLVVNDLRPAAARPLLARGATWAASPAEVAAAAQTVITILPTSREVREVLLGTKGLLDALRPGRSEERRVGKECTMTCRSRWSPYH